jgi:hypothetical protein
MFYGTHHLIDINCGHTNWTAPPLYCKSRQQLGVRDGSFRNESFQVNDSLQGVVNDQLTEEGGIIHLGTICRTVPLLAS